MSSRDTRATSGFIWAAVSQGGRTFVQLLTVAVLSRLLPAADFGVLAMASVVTTFAGLLRDMGTSAAVIQREQLQGELLDTIFWFNVYLGIALAGLLAVLAGPLAAAFREPRLAGVLLALTVTFPAMSSGAVHQSLLERALRFRTLARIELTSAGCAFLVAVAAAWSGLGVYSLALNAIAAAVFTNIQLFAASRWRPTLRWSFGEFRRLLHFSGNLFGFQSLNYLARNADTMLIGRYLGAVDVGWYNMGYRIMLFPLASLSAVIARVLFPVLARRQADLPAFAALYLKASGAVATVTAPLMAGLWVLREPFVTVFLGPHWSPVAEVLEWFAPVGFIQSVLTSVGLIYMATGNTRAMMRWGVFSGVLTVIAMAIGLQWGFLGVAKCYALVSLLLVYPGFAIPLRFIGLRFSDILRAVRQQLATAGIMAGVMFWLEHALAESILPVPRLVLLTITGVAIYVCVGFVTMRATLLDVLRRLFPLGAAIAE